MVNTRFSSILSLIVLAALAAPLSAQNRVRAGDAGSTLNMTPAQRTFGQDYVSAITGPDIERYKKLLHPRTRACINRENTDFFEAIFKRRVGRYAKNPRLSVEKVKDPRMFTAARSNGLNYPSRPSHVLKIDMMSSGANQYAISAFIVREAGLWYEVLPCPSSKSLDMMRESQRRDAAETMKARALADSLQDPLRAEVISLLQVEGPVSATKRYAEAAQLDLTMARRVVKALEKEITLVH